MESGSSETPITHIPPGQSILELFTSNSTDFVERTVAIAKRLSMIEANMVNNESCRWLKTMAGFEGCGSKFPSYIIEGNTSCISLLHNAFCSEGWAIFPKGTQLHKPQAGGRER